MSHLPRTLVLACALASTSAFAADTITFEGVITDQTCEVKLNGQDQAKVKLPTYSVAAFSQETIYAGQTEFKMTLSGCDSVSKTKRAQLEFSTAKPTEKNNLENVATDSPATGIAVQLFEDVAGTNVLEFGKERAKVALSAEFEAANTTEKTFFARYIKEGSEVKAGAVKAIAEYTLSYL